MAKKITKNEGSDTYNIDFKGLVIADATAMDLHSLMEFLGKIKEVEIDWREGINLSTISCTDFEDNILYASRMGATYTITFKHVALPQINLKKLFKLYAYLKRLSIY